MKVVEFRVHIISHVIYQKQFQRTAAQCCITFFQVVELQLYYTPTTVRLVWLMNKITMFTERKLCRHRHQLFFCSVGQIYALASPFFPYLYPFTALPSSRMKIAMSQLNVRHYRCTFCAFSIPTLVPTLNDRSGHVLSFDLRSSSPALVRVSQTLPPRTHEPYASFGTLFA